MTEHLTPLEINRQAITALQSERLNLIIRASVISQQLTVLWETDHQLSMERMQGGTKLTPGKLEK